MRRTRFDTILSSLTVTILAVMIILDIHRAHTPPPLSNHITSNTNTPINIDVLPAIFARVQQDLEQSRIKKQQAMIEEARNIIDVRDMPREYIQGAADRGVDVN